MEDREDEEQRRSKEGSCGEWADEIEEQMRGVGEKWQFQIKIDEKKENKQNTEEKWMTRVKDLFISIYDKESP